MQSRIPSLSVVVFVGLTLALFVPLASAGSPQDPEMPDKTGDVDPLSLTGLKPQELDQVQGNASMFDIRHAYVTSENKEGFWFGVEVVDLDGGLQDEQPPAPLPVPLMGPPLLAQFDVHFTAGGAGWWARATLEPWTYVDPSQDPPVVSPPMFLANFTLHKDDPSQTYVTQLAGLVSPQFETVFFHVPKDVVGAPAAGETMTGLYAKSSFNGTVLDHAPDAKVDPAAVDPGDPLKAVFVPQSGDVYEFGQYPGSGAAAKLELTANGDTTIQSDGGPVELALTLKNTGNKALDVRVGTTDPRGWTVQVDPETLTLQPGSSNAIIVTATPSPDAGRQGVLKVTASTQYETQTVIYVLQNAAAEGSGPDSGSPSDTGTGPTGDGADGPDQSLGESENEDSPGIGAVALVGALVGTVYVVRRRRV